MPNERVRRRIIHASSVPADIQKMHTRLIFTIVPSDADPSGRESEYDRKAVEFLVTWMK